MKKILLIISSFSLLLLASCDQDCIVKFVDFEFDILDFSISEEPWNVHEEINKDSLGISISMLEDIVKKQHKNGGCYCTSSINSVSYLSIKALYDYSDDFPAGSNITSLFKQKEYAYDGSSIFIPVEEYIATLTNSASKNAYAHFSLRLLDTTCISDKQKFEITIGFSDSTIVTKQTNDLILK